MIPKFREDKTTQAAGYLIELAGGKINYMKLIKLLYLADREAISAWEVPITFDQYVSMDNGPVLSKTYDLINWGAFPGNPSYWAEYISSPSNFEVSLLKTNEKNKLSEAELDLLQQIHKKYGKFNQWDLVTITHKLPEYTDPKGSVIPINIRDILSGLGIDKESISRIEENFEAKAYIESIC